MPNKYNHSNVTPIKAASPLHLLIAVCLVALICYAAAMLGGILVLRPEMIWPLWPGCAFLVAVLLLTPRKTWAVLLASGLVGFALYDLREELSIRAITLLLVSDAIEILLAAVGVRYLFSGVPRINSIRSLTKYSLFAVILAPLAVAALAGSALETGSWRVAFFTEALALLTVTPAVLSWAEIVDARAKKPKLQYLEAALMCIGLASVSYLAFAASAAKNRPALLYSLVPFLLWAALRFGISGTSNSMVIVSFMAIWGTVHRRGPFVGDTPVNDVLSLQLFLLVASGSFMVLAAVVDEQKTAEQTVRESERRFRSVADTAPVLIWMSGIDKLYTYFNKSWLDFTGRSMNEELGNRWAEGVHPEDVQRYLYVYKNSFDCREKFRMEYRLRRHDGEYRWILDIGVPRFNLDQSFAGYIGVAIDVTERKRAEDALADTNRKLIEAQERERARIGRELHDDVNQRLAMLAIQLQQLQRTPSDIQDRVQELRKQVIEISNDVQAFSHELHSSKLEYLGVVAGIRSWCREFGERHGTEINFKAEVADAIPPEIGVTLLRILQEALHNATKHSSVKRVEVQLAEREREIHLTVSDQGKGFDVEVARRGAGLGLASMEERVRLVNGTIAIHSEPMVGTSIHVRVPLEPERRSQRRAV